MPTQIGRPQVTRTTRTQEIIKAQRSHRHHRLWLCQLAFSLGTQSYFPLPFPTLPRLADTQAEATALDFTDLIVEYGMGGMRNGEWSLLSNTDSPCHLGDNWILYWWDPHSCESWLDYKLWSQDASIHLCVLFILVSLDLESWIFLDPWLEVFIICFGSKDLAVYFWYIGSS